MFLDIIHRPLFISKHRSVYITEHVSQTGFSLRLRVTPTRFGPIDGASPLCYVI
jgi:hypothetical protein